MGIDLSSIIQTPNNANWMTSTGVKHFSMLDDVSEDTRERCLEEEPQDTAAFTQSSRISWQPKIDDCIEFGRKESGNWNGSWKTKEILEHARSRFKALERQPLSNFSMHFQYFLGLSHLNLPRISGWYVS